MCDLTSWVHFKPSWWSQIGLTYSRIRQWCSKQIIGGGPIKVYNVQQVTAIARQVAESKTYRDNAALVAIKVLQAAHMLKPLTPLDPDIDELDIAGRTPGAHP